MDIMKNCIEESLIQMRGTHGNFVLGTYLLRIHTQFTNSLFIHPFKIFLSILTNLEPTNDDSNWQFIDNKTKGTLVHNAA